MAVGPESGVDGYPGLWGGFIGRCVFLGVDGAFDEKLLHSRCLGDYGLRKR